MSNKNILDKFEWNCSLLSRYIMCIYAFSYAQFHLRTKIENENAAYILSIYLQKMFFTFDFVVWKCMISSTLLQWVIRLSHRCSPVIYQHVLKCSVKWAVLCNDRFFLLLKFLLHSSCQGCVLCFWQIQNARCAFCFFNVWSQQHLFRIKKCLRFKKAFFKI